jgi:hypothetical protein
MKVLIAINADKIAIAIPLFENSIMLNILVKITRFVPICNKSRIHLSVSSSMKFARNNCRKFIIIIGRITHNHIYCPRL